MSNSSTNGTSTKQRRPRKSRQAVALPVQEIQGMEWATHSKPSQINWLIPGAIPIGAYTVLEGRKGTGKSTCLAAIAASITGGPVLPGWTGPTNGTVIWQSSEDPWEAVVIPRLVAAGARLDKVGRLRLPKGQDGFRIPSIPNDIPILRKILLDSNARLLVLDPSISCADSALDMRLDQQARSYCERISELCWELEITAVLTRNIRKGNQGDVRDAGLGSVAIGNVARSVLRIDEHPHTRGVYCLSVVACNLGRKMRTMTYRIIDGEGSQTRIEWLETSQLETDSIIEQTASPAERDEWTDADRVLYSIIGQDWVRVQLIVAEAGRAQVSEKTLRRSKTRLGVRSRRVQLGSEGHWEWGPPEDGWPSGLESGPDHIV